MRKACLVVSDNLTKNRIFDQTLHRDNCNDRFTKLKAEFRSRGFELSTHDLISFDESEIILYAENLPKKLPVSKNIWKSYLILSESPFIRPDNYDLNKHKFFEKVFTWHDDFVDGCKYIKLNYAQDLSQPINKNLQRKNKMCALIAGNKKAKYDLESRFSELGLYAEREKAIRWFEKNSPDDFDLFGIGWDKFTFEGPKIVRYLNRLPLLPRLVKILSGGSYKSYRGRVHNKKAVLETYKFSICYENAKNIPGYITEKIFDSFIGGCVPVYFGANNVENYIPSNCYINWREFSGYSELHNYMKYMDDQKYMDYLVNIQNYLNSDAVRPFTSEGFVKTIIDTVLGPIE